MKTSGARGGISARIAVVGAMRSAPRVIAPNALIRIAEIAAVIAARKARLLPPLQRLKQERLQQQTPAHRQIVARVQNVIKIAARRKAAMVKTIKSEAAAKIRASTEISPVGMAAPEWVKDWAAAIARATAAGQTVEISAAIGDAVKRPAGNQK